MKIKSMIEELKKYNPDTEVWAYDFNNDCYLEVESVCEDEDDNETILLRIIK